MPSYSKYQGDYFLTEAEKKKYTGSKPPYFRSLLEKRFMYWANNNTNVISWGNENVIIPYVWAVDGKVHRYVVDFKIRAKNRQGIVEDILIEIKPSKEEIPPIKPKTNNRKAQNRYKEECLTFIKNQNKWDAARKYSQQNNMRFVVMTEKDL
jgi:hypothetical protein